MLKKAILSGLIVLTHFSLLAGEGMWIPLLLKQLNINDMQAKGLKLSAEDIYSINQSSLKDAIVHFGGGCTSEIISSDGLLLTNHHCGYGRIQAHSSVEHDYLTDGYWAMNQEEELTNPGLTATLINRMEDVTTKVLEGVSEEMEESERKKIIDANIKTIEEESVKGTHYGASVKSFYYGNAYYLFITETFKDIRLVGAPPSSIGKFGFDTDNWIWPRHTGDFSLFRIYAGKDNKPAEYSKDNVPYQPKHFLPISLKGVKKDDFTMVYGFPGRTEEYLTSFAVELIQEVSDPLKIAIRDKKLEVMNKAMASSDEIRIKYAAKQSRTSNSWKKWKGQIRGLKKLNAIEKKQELEKFYTAAVKANQSDFSAYNDLFEQFEKQYQQLHDLQIARDYFVEAAYNGADLIYYCSRFRKQLSAAQEGKTPDSLAAKELLQSTRSHFKNYDLATDQQLFEALIGMYYHNAPRNSYYPEVFVDQIKGKFKGDVKAFAKYIYSKSVFTDPSKMEELLTNWDMKTALKLSKDPAYVVASQLFNNYFERIRPAYMEIQAELARLNRTYLKSIQKVLPDHKKYYPDANSTLRIAYGKIESYEPRDGVFYDYYTTLDGIIEKYNPNTKEFNLPKKLLELHASKTYGKYGKDGQLPVCFIASNHTTGGNSGSPVLDGTGALIGLNFDRNWEGTMSDIMYDPSQCRNIAVDIRYVLFIIDKFAGAGYLLENMELK